MHILPTWPALASLMSKEESRDKGTMGCPTSPSPPPAPMSQFQPKCWLIHGSSMNEDMMVDPWLFVFLTMPLPSPVFQASSDLNRSHGLSVANVIHWPCPHSESRWTSCFLGAAEFCAQAHHECSRGGCVPYYKHLLCSPLSHWTSLAKHKFKGKIIKTLKMAQQSRNSESLC